MLLPLGIENTFDPIKFGAFLGPLSVSQKQLCSAELVNVHYRMALFINVTICSHLKNVSLANVH